MSNYYLYHLPLKIITGTAFDESDEPSMIRNDESFTEMDEGQ